MKTSTAQLLVALFAASARATGEACTPVALSSIPVCAQQCFINGAIQIGCSGVDFECQCKQQAALYAAIESCVASSCAAAEFQAVIDGAAAVCDCVNGVPAGAGAVSSPSGGSLVPTPPQPTPSVPPSTVPQPPAPTTTETATGGAGGGGSSAGGGSATGGASGGSSATGGGGGGSAGGSATGSASGSATGGGGGGGSPTQSSPGGGATSSVVPGAASQSKAQLGLAVAALLGLAML